MKPEDILLEKVDIHTLTLLACEKSFDMGKFALQTLTVERVKSLFEDELEYAMRALVPAENVYEKTDTLRVEYPSNWKEAFKEEHFPNWLKKRFPVKYKRETKTIKFTAYDIYPDFPWAFQDMYGKRVRQIIETIEE